jgi:hypothetical protein
VCVCVCVLLLYRSCSIIGGLCFLGVGCSEGPMVLAFVLAAYPCSLT